ncbi:S8 family serine peptidase [Pelagibacterium nitratireducens]|uniref:S8 family serine peptidase n=1 Tax=Pelagibacterium nitratireducens TaxID=1046114 RepID=A0ABZ2I2H8_9HYPH
MAREPEKAPLLNPVLRLTKGPVPEEPPVGGQGEAGVVAGRLSAQRVALAESCRRISAESASLSAHGGRIHLIVEMFSDSFAPTWTPKGLVALAGDAKLVAPASRGYLAEIPVDRLEGFAKQILTAQTIEARTAISRVRSIRALDAEAVTRGRKIETLWELAEEVEGGKAFAVWLRPFRDHHAKSSVVQSLVGLEERRRILRSFSSVALNSGDQAEGAPAVRNESQSALNRVVRQYREHLTARAVLTIPSIDALGQIVASGTLLRVDPVAKVGLTAPSEGNHPAPPLPSALTQPVIAVVDGGHSARSYAGLEAWKAIPLVPQGIADVAHGNRVTSLVVHGYAWNNKLNLPQLDCRFGTVAAVAKASSNQSPTPDALVDYLRQIARRYPEAKVWNLSFNQLLPEFGLETVSYLGHEISRLARDFAILPIISVGNRGAGNPSHQLCPPADCEAALVVSGREYDHDGKPAGDCSVSLLGPGPDGMLKPDLSWFSRVNMLGGGDPRVGSSYATPLVSSLAAHTFAVLKNPSPDLVKALLIDRSELMQHSRTQGWGTPFHGTLPWLCKPGSVTMAWKSELVPGYAYHWDDIPIPPELIVDGKLKGKARLTAILDPLLSETGGPNYFSTRLQVALQYKNTKGAVANLLGSMRESTDPEQSARDDLAKWYPVRRHARDFSKRTGIQFTGSSFRLRAQVFARDLFQFEVTSQRELGEQSVAFVLTLESQSDEPAIYNSTAQRLRSYVESAVIDQELEVDVFS